MLALICRRSSHGAFFQPNPWNDSGGLVNMIQEVGRGCLGRFLQKSGQTQTSLGIQATSRGPITLALSTIGYRGSELPSGFPSNSHLAIIPMCMRYCFVTTMGEDMACHDSYPRRFFMVPSGMKTAAGWTERGQCPMDTTTVLFNKTSLICGLESVDCSMLARCRSYLLPYWGLPFNLRGLATEPFNSDHIHFLST